MESQMNSPYHFTSRPELGAQGAPPLLVYSIPPSSPEAVDAAGMAAKHARTNAMAQTITLLELII
jgi:hypothetical protein